jgi:hypothetical protein
MALESILTRMQAVLAENLAGFTLASGEPLRLVRAVLEYDLAEFRTGKLTAYEGTILFRAVDAEHFRSLTNVTLDDRMRPTVTGAVAELETVAMDLGEVVFIEALLSKDQEVGADVTYDLCVDADVNDDAAGQWLNADQAVSLSWDAAVALDLYPADKLVIRVHLKGTGAAGVRSVRFRVTMLGKNMLSDYVRAVGLLAAARFWMERSNALLKSGADPLTVAAIDKRILNLQGQGRGILGLGSSTGGRAVSTGGGAATPPIVVTGLPATAFWERYQKGM